MADEDKKLYESVSVLVIDDEIHTRQMIRGILRQIGIVSTSDAADGKAGLGEILRVRPTLVLCDIHMRPVDGRQFLTMVRAAKVDWVRNMPVIFLTADSKPETIRFAKDLRVDGYLVKPISMGDLKARIDAVLKAAGSTASP